MELVNAVIAAPFACCGWLIVGFIAGALARRLVGSPDRSFVSDIILGLIGAFVGGFVLNLLVGYTKPESGIGLWIANIVVATIGAAILIFIGNALSGGARRR
ncbi:MAG: GlsB/YeaQ/YmgE family stress response membrane protein [Anaerolineae bacterium]|nr:GlsB/YeaQ/YmgE family stress response membrane protein [Anaerolineae bacterium]